MLALFQNLKADQAQEPLPHYLQGYEQIVDNLQNKTRN